MRWVAVMTFWEGLMLSILFSVIFKILPSSGLTSWKSWILPAITLSTQPLAACMRMTRSSMLEEIRQDYVRTTRAKGQTEFLVVINHAFRNSILPIITDIGVNFARLMGGAAVIEIVFSIPGLGKLIVDAISVKMPRWSRMVSYLLPSPCPLSTSSPTSSMPWWIRASAPSI